MIKVYFRRMPLFWDDRKPSYALADFDLAATVKSDDLDDAYAATNSIEEYWGVMRGIATAETHPNGKGWRSCSCGDIMERDGKYHIVSTIGFREVEVT